MESELAIHGVGTQLPPVLKVRDLAAQAGGDASAYHGWDVVSRARDHEHPSTLAAGAVREALADAGVAASELRLVISGGVSRDYPGSFSISTEVMRLLGAPKECFGIDIGVGCLGVITGFEMASGWLAGNGGGYAAIVASERWNFTIDYTDCESFGIWGHADGGAAAIVGLGAPGRALARYRGCCFTTNSEYNGYVRIQYGGTRYPVAPPGASPFARKLMRSAQTASDAYRDYLDGYARVVNGVLSRFGASPAWVICNQVSPNFLGSIADVCRVGRERVCTTGPEHGHVGSADLLIGARRLLDAGELRGPILMAASTTYAMGACLLEE